LFPVDGTPFDFRTATPIGARIDANDVQLRYGHGYDHNLVLDGTGLRRVVSLGEPVSGRVMEVWTTEPGLQLYTGNYLDGSIRGKGGIPYGRRCALCLETQHFPDSPNHPSFPGTILRPGEIRVSKTVFVFGAESRRGRTS
jgi:aldose 1-epimerase